MKKQNKAAAREWHQEQKLESQKKEHMLDLTGAVYGAENKLRGVNYSMERYEFSDKVVKKVETARQLLDEAYEEMRIITDPLMGE